MNPRECAPLKPLIRWLDYSVGFGGGLLTCAAEYTATTRQGRVACATDPVMEHTFDIATKRGCRYFDFGTCTLDEGHSLNQDLYHFKVSFGGGGVLYHHYELDLRLCAASAFTAWAKDPGGEDGTRCDLRDRCCVHGVCHGRGHARDISEPAESEMRRTDGLERLATSRMLS